VPISLFTHPWSQMRSPRSFFALSLCFPVCTVRFSVGRPRPFMRHLNAANLGNTKPSNTSNGSSPQTGSLHSKAGSAKKLREILERKNLSLSQVSLASARLFGGQSLYHVPHNLYFDLRNKRFTPNLYQLIALSSISGYSLTDWLSVFDVHLDDIVRLQLLLSFPRTILLDAVLYDSHASIPWFEEMATPPAQITPLIQIVSHNTSERVDALQRGGKFPFIYAKVGIEDDFSFPELHPGSVVRADPRSPKARLTKSGANVSRDLFLVKHARGFNCCRLQQVAPDRVVLVSSKPTAPRIELQFGRELAILGTIDMEFRSLQRINRAVGSRSIPRLAARELVQTQTPHVGLYHLLRNGRQQNGLSFRQASAMSRTIAAELGDERYFTAIGSLSDYEASEMPPRHIHKILSLCTLYSLNFWEFLRVSGLAIDKIGAEAIPDDLAKRTHIPVSSRYRSEEQQSQGKGTFLSALTNRFEEIPFFLRDALPGLCGMSRVSLRDIFWVADEGQEFHAPLRGAALLVVNRRVNTPVISESERQWGQPVYLLARRDGSYFCGRFSLEGKTEVFHPLTGSPPSMKTAVTRYDAEIVGQVVAALRHLQRGR